MASRVRELIEQLLVEYDAEVQQLRAENTALQEKLLSVECEEPPVPIKVGSRHGWMEPQSVQAVAPAEPQIVLTEELAKLEDFGKETPIHPAGDMASLHLGDSSVLAGAWKDPETPSRAFGENSSACPSPAEGNGSYYSVRAIFYGIQRLSFPPGVAGLTTTTDVRATVMVTCGEMSGATRAVSLHQELAQIPHQILPQENGNDTTWKAAWDKGGADVLLNVPSPQMTEELALAIHAEGLGFLASGRVKVNAGKQSCQLDGGGLVEYEILAEQVGQLSAMVHRTSTNTRERIVRRLEKLFEVKDDKVKVVMALDLGQAMQKASLMKSNLAKSNVAKFESALNPEELDEVMVELKRIHDQEIEKGRKRARRQPVLSWNGFVECMLLPDLPKFTSGPTALNLFIVQRELLGDDMPATGTSTALLMAYEKTKKPISRSQRWVNLVTALSTGGIIVSFVLMGVALDTDPNLLIWLLLDTIVALIFVAEVVVKSLVFTAREYFFGRDRVWNCFDVGLSLVAVAEIAINIIYSSSGDTAKAALVLRGLRLARMARLAKLIRMPLLAELANLISGFVLSVRSLFWVMIFLTLIVYVIALGFRAGVETFSGTMPDNCLMGDFYPLGNDLEQQLPPGCKLHYMYGLEFCASVVGCMFSIFRCMISECTTKGGRSLTMIFSDGIGLEFDMFYAVSMVVVLFGLFNIITAIFVEATLNGLKENEVQRKYAKAYESNYMTEQLAKLVMTVSTQVQKLRSRTALPGLQFSNRSVGNRQENALQDGEIYLSEEEFNQLVRHPDVRLILNDLDVSVEPRPGIFEAFHTEEDGTVSLSELVSGLMRLRGELHKVDMIIAQMSLDTVVKQIADLKKAQGLGEGHGGGHGAGRRRSLL